MYLKEEVIANRRSQNCADDVKTAFLYPIVQNKYPKLKLDCDFSAYSDINKKKDTKYIGNLIDEKELERKINFKAYLKLHALKKNYNLANCKIVCNLIIANVSYHI